jgi:hypothetical protein
MEEMSTLTASPEYSALLKKFPPKVIRTEKENEAYTELLYELDQRGNLTAAEKEFARLLTLLIEDFEARSYPNAISTKTTSNASAAVLMSPPNCLSSSSRACC